MFFFHKPKKYYSYYTIFLKKMEYISEMFTNCFQFKACKYEC